MQGRLAIAIVMAAVGADGAMCAEAPKRQTCQKAGQPQQRQQQAQPQPQRAKPQGCPVNRTIPPAVDPTPVFFL